MFQHSNLKKPLPVYMHVPMYGDWAFKMVTGETLVWKKMILKQPKGEVKCVAKIMNGKEDLRRVKC